MIVAKIKKEKDHKAMSDNRMMMIIQMRQTLIKCLTHFKDLDSNLAKEISNVLLNNKPKTIHKEIDNASIFR